MGNGGCCGTSSKAVKGKKIVMFGLNKSGKTTILYLVTKGQYVPAITTLGQNQEILNFEKSTYTLYDFGGSNTDLLKLREHLSNSRGIIFTVDSSDEARLKESQELFRQIISEKTLKDLPILIFLSKCDLPQAVDEEALKKKFNLINFSQIDWYIQKCSSLKREGINEGFKWLTQKMASKRKSPTQTSNNLPN